MAFGKTKLLNRLIVQSRAEYLIFTDGDCIPTRDFVASHLQYAKSGGFLSGGCLRLSAAMTRRICDGEFTATGHAIDTRGLQRITDPTWLRGQGERLRRYELLRMIDRVPKVGVMMDSLTTTAATFNGHNASAWRSDVLAAGGFDERMRDGGLDRELGERLVNAGVRPHQVRHRIRCLHLDHPRGYRNANDRAANDEIRRQTQQLRLVRTRFGIPFPPAADRHGDIPNPAHRLA